jgi:hypothetical protein
MIRHARQLVTAPLGAAILLTACTGAGGLKGPGPGGNGGRRIARKRQRGGSEP